MLYLPKLLIMRKSIALAIVLLTVLFLSCSKKDKIDENELNGTSWEVYVSEDDNETISFTSNTELAVTGKVTGATYTLIGTYTYNKPNISILITNVPNAIMGVVSGNSMTLTANEQQGEVIYNKK